MNISTMAPTMTFPTMTPTITFPTMTFPTLTLPDNITIIKLEIKLVAKLR